VKDPPDALQTQTIRERPRENAPEPGQVGIRDDADPQDIRERAGATGAAAKRRPT